MVRTVKSGKLTALAVTNAKEPGIYGDGAGLWLRVQHNGSKSWSFRYTLNGAREMGLGPLTILDLAEARRRAREARLLVLDGKDPIEDRRAKLKAAKIEAGRAETFKACAEGYIKGHKAGWKSLKHGDQWAATLKTYAYPFIGDLPIAKMDTALVLKVLEPIWQEIPETAARVRGRIERIWDWARVRGHCTGENPARWRGHLESALPKLADVRVVEHQPALGYAKVGSFMRDLRKQDGIAAAALEFTILTAARTNETINAVWPEIDRQNAVWVIPAERMKGRRGKSREHRVPLTPQALAVLERMARFGSTGYVFPGMIEDQPLSNMAMLELLRRMERKDITVHGFRSTFRDWAAESTPFPHEVVEMALAHTIKNKAEAAYRRGDLLDKRRKLMEAWADYCDRQPVADGANVISITQAVA